MKQVVVSKRFVKMNFPFSRGLELPYPKALDLFRVFCYPKLTGRVFCPNFFLSSLLSLHREYTPSHKVIPSRSRSKRYDYNRDILVNAYLFFNGISRVRAHTFAPDFRKSSSSFLVQRASFSSFY